MSMKICRIELDNEFEADVFTAMLDEESIPYTVINHYSLAYGSVFQMTTGWGHIEVPEEYQEKALDLFQNYKKSLVER
jgi:hypothetical protein